MQQNAPSVQEALQAPLQGPKATFDLQQVIVSSLERIHAEFGSMLQAAAASGDADRKRLALAYLHAARQQLLRLVSLVQWHPKAKALLCCVQPNSVLDVARRHAQALEGGALELYESHMRRQPDLSPMFDVQTALDVLSTGTYADLPSSIAKLGKLPEASPEQQARRLRHITHLIHVKLLQAKLPPGCEVSHVGGGTVTLGVPGLYEAKLTLVPGLELPHEPTPVPSGQPGDVAAAVGPSGVAGVAQLAGEGAACQGGAEAGTPVGQDAEEEVTSGKPQRRWRWLLLSFQLLANSVEGPALRESQTQNLLRDLNNRMHVAADSAVYVKRRNDAAARATAAGEAVDGAPAGPAQPAAVPAASGPQPAGSTRTSTSRPVTVTAGGKATGATGGTGSGSALRFRARFQEWLASTAADEASAPLAVLHTVLGEVGARLTVDGAKAILQRLVQPFGCWAGQASVEPGAARLELGFTVRFWSKAVLLLPSPPPPLTSVGTAGGSSAPPGAVRPMAPPPLKAQEPGPVLEIGVGEDGRVRAVTNVNLAAPPPAPGSAPPPHIPPTAPALPDAAGAGPSSAVAIPAAAPGQGATAPGAGGKGPAAGTATPTGQAPAELPLNPMTVNVDELLLRAAGILARHDLEVLQGVLNRELTHLAVPGTAWEVRLSHTSMLWLPQAARPLVDALTVEQAAAGAGPTTAIATAAAQQARALQGGDGSAGTHPTDALTSRLQVSVQFPVLEFWSLGEVLVRISRSLFTGRLLLQPGPSLSMDASLNTVASWSQREDELNNLLARLNQQQQGASQALVAADPAGGGAGTTGAAAAHERTLTEVGRRLATLLREQQRAAAVTMCMSTARQLHLQMGGPGTQLITAYHTQHPWADLKRHFLLWSLPPTPFPPGFPALYPTPPGTHRSRQPCCMSFVLAADHPAVPAPSYSLIAVACSSQMIPLKVTRVIPVPVAVAAAPAAAPHVLNGGAGPAPMDVDGGNQQPHLTQQQTRQGGVGPAGGASGRNLHTEFVRVVQWCRQRAVWEKLFAQLKAVGAEYVEVGLSGSSSPPTSSAPPVAHNHTPALGPGGREAREASHSLARPSIVLVAVGGVRLPCRIARRKGAVPPRVGIRRVTLTPGDGHTDEQVVMEFRGTWFQLDAPGSSGAQAGGGGPHSAAARLGGGGTAAAPGSTGPPGLRAARVEQHSDTGVVRLHYSLAHGHSVLDMAADLLCVLRVQTFLARLEAMSRGPRTLCVCAAARRGAGGALAPPPHKRLGGEAVDASAYGKRARVGGEEPPMNGLPDGDLWHSDEPGKALTRSSQGQEAGSECCVWSWHPNADVRLVSYDFTCAVLVSTPGGVDKRGVSGAGAGSWGPLTLHVSWVPDTAPNEGSGSAEAASVQPTAASLSTAPSTWSVSTLPTSLQRTGSTPRLAGRVLPPNPAAGMSRSQSLASLLATGTAAGPAAVSTASAQRTPLPSVGWEWLARCRVTATPQASMGVVPAGSGLQGAAVECGTGPLSSLLHGLQDMADAGEEGLWLDALTVCAHPMQAVQLGLAGPGVRTETHRALPRGVCVVHSSEQGPFQHELFLTPPASAVDAGLPACVTVRVICMAVGRTWLHVCLPRAPSTAARDPQSARGGTSFLAGLVKQLHADLGEGAQLYVASAWSDLGPPPPRGGSGPGGGAGSAHPAPLHLWVLVGNPQLKRAVRVVLQVCQGVQPAA